MNEARPDSLADFRKDLQELTATIKQVPAGVGREIAAVETAFKSGVFIGVLGTILAISMLAGIWSLVRPKT